MAFNQFGYSPYGGTGYNPGQTYFPQPQPMQQPQIQPMQGGVMCRPVASIEEARAMQVQFDGSLYAFINLSAGEIYTKQFNFNTGSTDFEIYSKKAPAAPVVYATADEVAALRRELAAMRGEGVVNAE